MIVVDTTVWADWFSGAESPEIGRLARALDRQDAGLVPLILTEVLQGFRAERDFERARGLLVQLPLLELDVEGHAAAVELLNTDRDFVGIARHTQLRLCAV